MRKAGMAAVGLALTLELAPGLASAATGVDPDWPCPQRLVPELSVGQLWGGRPLDDVPAGATLAPALKDLPVRIVPGAASEADAARLIGEALAGVPEEERETQRALLFRETLAVVNAARNDLIARIKRYAQGQRRLAEKITGEGRQLAQLRKDPAQAAAVQDLDNQRAWDMRFYDERQRSLRPLCDQPVVLEQRAFALARIIQGQAP